MNELTEQLRHSFQDEEYRNAYAESFMNSFVAAQIKTLREENDLTQEELAGKIGTKQAGISRLENVNYSAWKVDTLRKLARALGVRLKITFEEFGTLPSDINGFNREALLRARFDEDPVFSAAETAVSLVLDEPVLPLPPLPRSAGNLVSIEDARNAIKDKEAKVKEKEPEKPSRPMTVIPALESVRQTGARYANSGYSAG